MHNAASVYTCRECGTDFLIRAGEFNGDGYFHPDGEELLWGHIQLEHPTLFREMRDMDTPSMLELCYTTGDVLYRIYYCNTEDMYVMASCEDEAVEIAKMIVGGRLVFDDAEVIT